MYKKSNDSIDIGNIFCQFKKGIGISCSINRSDCLKYFLNILKDENHFDVNSINSNMRMMMMMLNQTYL